MTSQPLTGDGTFGRFGGRMMPEALMAALDELTVAWQDAMADPEFTAEFERLLPHGREERVVDDDQRAGLPGPARDRRHVDDAQQRIAGRLDPHQGR